MSDSVIIRHKTSRDYTVLRNEVVRDQRLSWKALGLLVYILHLPPDFRLRLIHLAKQRAKEGRSGRDATRAGLHELEASGYLTISRERGPCGKFTQVTWTVTDMPESEPHSDFPNVDKPQKVLPATGNPTLLNTNTEKELNLQRTTTTNPVSSLHFPRMLGIKERRVAADLLVNIPPQSAQELLDELSDALESSSIKTSPLRWLRGMICHYENGNFVPTGAIRIAARREAHEQTQLAQKAKSSNTQPSNRGVAQAHLDTIKQMTTTKNSNGPNSTVPLKCQ